MSPLQYRIYQFIQTHLTQYGYSPSLSEIAAGVGIKLGSKSLISRHIQALTKNGLLSMSPGKYRSIQLPASQLELPIVGKIAAGQPIEAIEQQETLNLDQLLREKNYYILKVDGNSMIDEGILDGDHIICKKQTTAKENDIVIALIDQEQTTLKRLHYEKSHIVLIPANPVFKPKKYLAERISIQGIFIGLLRFSY